MTVPSGIVLGSRYTDTVTDIEGTVTHVFEHINGCVTVYLLTKVTKKGKITLHECDDIRLRDVDGRWVLRRPSQAEGRLGKRYRDEISRFEGIATQRVWLLNGSIQLTLEPGVNDKGELGKQYRFDEDRLLDTDTQARLPEKVGVGGAVVEVHR